MTPGNAGQANGDAEVDDAEAPEEDEFEGLDGSEMAVDGQPLLAQNLVNGDAPQNGMAPPPPPLIHEPPADTMPMFAQPLGQAPLLFSSPTSPSFSQSQSARSPTTSGPPQSANHPPPLVLTTHYSDSPNSPAGAGPSASTATAVSPQGTNLGFPAYTNRRPAPLGASTASMEASMLSPASHRSRPASIISMEASMLGPPDQDSPEPSTPSALQHS